MDQRTPPDQPAPATEPAGPAEPIRTPEPAPVTPPSHAEQGTASASGLVYGDVPNRAIAYILDAIMLFVINLVVGLVIGMFLPSVSFNPNVTNPFAAVQVNYGSLLVIALINLAISGVYFVYTWTQMGGSPGQRVLGMKVTNVDGAALTRAQALKRWIFLGAPFGLASALNPIPVLGLLIALAGLAYFIYLLVSTAQSPTKQGFHDQQVNSIVVKAARAVS